MIPSCDGVRSDQERLRSPRLLAPSTNPNSILNSNCQFQPRPSRLLDTPLAPCARHRLDDRQPRPLPRNPRATIRLCKAIEPLRGLWQYLDFVGHGEGDAAALLRSDRLHVGLHHVRSDSTLEPGCDRIAWRPGFERLFSRSIAANGLGARIEVAPMATLARGKPLVPPHAREERRPGARPGKRRRRPPERQIEESPMMRSRRAFSSPMTPRYRARRFVDRDSGMSTIRGSAQRRPAW